MLRVKVSPPIDYFYTFLQTRGFLLVDDKPNILHYVGESEKELFDLIKEDKPDLIILHKIFPNRLQELNLFWVWQPVKNEKDLYDTRKLVTNSHRLCQTYYQRLGLQAEIQIVPKKEVKLGEFKDAPKMLNIRGLIQKVREFMIWA